MKHNTAFIITTLFLLALAVPALAANAPHNDANGVACNDCHNKWNGAAGPTYDDTPMNNLCASCHDGVKAPAKATHSGLETESTTTYGTNWMTQCIDCHDPHMQKQSATYKSNYSAGGAYLKTYTIASGGLHQNGGIYNQITVTPDPGWVPDDLQGFSVVLGTRRKLTYRISANTNNMITLSTPVAKGFPVSTRYVWYGGPVRLVYGKMMRDQIRAPRGIINSAGKEYDSALYRTVKFLNDIGPNSEADALNATQALCVVCHTRTKANNIGYAREGDAFDGTVSDYLNLSHKDRSSQTRTCWTSGCHQTHANGFDADCTTCHGGPPTSQAELINTPIDEYKTGRTSPGAHAAHSAKGIDTCTLCHAGGGSDGSNDDHNNAPHNVTIGFTHGESNGLYNTVDMTGQFNMVSGDTGTSVSFAGPTPGDCSNIYCHSAADGATYRTVNWDTAGPLACFACHGDTVSKYVDNAKHDLHAYGNYTYNCYECHSDTVDPDITIPSAKRAKHVLNAQKDVAFGNIGSGGGYTDASKTCSSIYCHSDGKEGDPPVNPKWGDAVTGNCNICHDDAGSDSTLSLAHAEHTDATGLNAGCADCHSATVSGNTTISDYSLHVDKIKNVVLSGNGADGLDYDSSAKTCATLNCHGSKSPAWTNEFPGIDPCVRCHGDDTATPTATAAEKAPGGAGKDTNGDTSAEDAEVGAHQLHLTTRANAYMDGLVCSDCHKDPGTNIFAVDHIDSALEAEVVFSVFASNDTVLSSYDYGTGECSNVYCHGGMMPKQSTNALNNKPIWNAVSYLSGVPNVEGGDCDQCHGAPPSGYAGNTHGGTESISACNGCHDHIDIYGNISDASLHIDGILQYSECDGCHGQPPVSGITLVTNPAVTGHTEGAHEYHWNRFSGTTEQCKLCHNGGGISGHTSSPFITMGFKYGTYTGGAYISTNDFSNGFALNSGDSGTTTVGFGTARECSNIYCHSDGGDYAGTLTPGTAGDWDSTFTFPADCNKCHGGGAVAVDNNVHPKHVTTYGLDCNTCHAGTVDSGLSIPAGKIGNHVNLAKNVIFNGGIATGTTYDGGKDASGPNCNTSYCHSQGRAAYAAPNTTPKWNATPGTLDCKGCHSSTVASGTIMNSVNHTSHINNSAAIGRDFNCVDCHMATLDTDTSIGAGKIGNHVNNSRDVLVSSTYDTGGFNYASGTCTNVYCHSNGNLDGSAPKFVKKAITWGSDNTTCKSCHGDATYVYPNYANGGVGVDANSHDKHANPAKGNLGCGECHSLTSTAGTAIDGTVPDAHVNKIANVAFSQGGSYDSGADTCSSTYCHGGPASPAWGTAGPLACDTCHPANKTLLEGSHPVHYNTTTMATDTERTAGNISNSGAHVYTCGVCHDGDPHGGGPANAPNMIANVIFNGTFAGAGTYAEGSLSGDAPDASGRNWTEGTCSTTYCHSKGEGTAGNVNPVWNVSSMTCASCHDAQPDTNAHKSHINNGTVMTDKNCVDCHSATATASDTIIDRRVHVNNTPDVLVNATDWGGSYSDPTCSSVYCHTDGRGNSADIAWDTGINATCTTCHGGAGGSTGGATTALSTPHTVHTDASGFNYDCVNCHTSVVDAFMNIVSPGISLHVNKTATVYVNATYGGDGTDYASNTCATTNCHGTDSTDWTVGGTTGDCSLCHGMAANLSDGRDTEGNTSAYDLEVGAHVAHLTNASIMSPAIECNNCHADLVGASYEAKVSAHLDGPADGMYAEFSWSILATNDGALSPSYNPATGECSNTYCHGNKMPKGSWQGVGNTPIWNSVDYLAGTDYNVDCAQCHNFPPTENSKHNSFTLGDGSNCHSCHSHLFDAGTVNEDGWIENGMAFSNANLHIDGIVQASGDCDSCHGYPPDIASEDKEYIGTGLEGKGAHLAHTDHLATITGNTLAPTTDQFTDATPRSICGACHDMSSDSNHDNGADNRQIKVPVGYKFGATNPAYNGNPATSSDTDFKSCSNVSCHFKDSPGWQNPASAGVK